MAQASASIDIPVSPDRVWQLIGGFDTLPDWLPYIPKSELTEGGRVRRLTNPNGDTIIERLVAFDDAARSYSYTIVQGPFPITGYLATLRVKETEDGSSRVEWFGRFIPKGVSEQEASRLFQCIYADGLKALAEGLATKNT